MVDKLQVSRQQIKPSTATSLEEQQIKELEQQALATSKVEKQSSSSGRDPFDEQARFVSDINSISEGSKFVINDIILDVPPTTIRIDRNNVNFKWHTIRSKRPIKVKSGHGNIQVSLSIYFVGIEAINKGLRRLIVELEHHPFVYISNSYLKDNISPGSTQNMAFTVLDFTIRTEPPLTETLVLDLDLALFNYKPFSRDFRYRETWESPVKDSPEEESPTNMFYESGLTHMCYSDPNKKILEDIESYEDNEIKIKNLLLKPTIPVDNPSQSTPYKQYYDEKLSQRQELRKSPGDESSVLEQSLTLKYYTYKEVKLPSSLEFLSNRTLKPGAIVPVEETHISRNDNVNLFMRPKAALDLLELSAAFENATKRKLPVSSCFRSFEEQAKLANSPKTRDVANAAGSSFHECGLAFDISFASMEANEYSWLVQNATKYNFNIDSRHRGISKSDRALRELHAKAVAGNPAAKEMWHFTYQDPTENKPSEVLKKIYQTEETFGTDKARNEAQLSYVEWLKKQLEDGWEEVPGFAVIFKKPRKVLISGSNIEPTPPGNKIVIASLACSMSNIVANLPVASHLYSTHQYLGSTDKELYLSMLSHGTGPLREIQIMNNILENNARKFRRVPGSSLIELYNNNVIVDLFGVRLAVIESITTETIEGNPDLFAVNLRLTEFFTDTAEKIAIEFVSDTTTRTKVIERLCTQLRINEEDPFRRYEIISNDLILRGDPTTSQKGLLEDLVTILDNLNFCIPTPEYKDMFNVPEVKMPLYGAEKFVIPKLGTVQDTATDLLVASNKSTKRGGTLVAKLIQKQLFGVLINNFFVAHSSVTGIISNLLNGDTLSTAIANGTKEGGEHLDTIQRIAIESARAQIQTLADNIIANYLDMPLFKDIKETLKNSGSVKGGQAYPDLDLPKHPLTTNALDTEPDWYFYNESEEGEKGFIAPELITRSSNFLMDAYTSYNTINNGTWFKKGYRSKNSTLVTQLADKDLMAADGYDIPADTQLTKTKIKHSNKAIIKGRKNQQVSKHGSPEATNEANAVPGAQTEFGPIKTREGEDSLHSFSSNALMETFKQSIKAFRNNTNTLRRAFPTFKIYFIEDELTVGADDTSLRNVRAFDDFYSYTAIQDLRIVRSRKIPADLAVITMTNISGLLDDRSFYKGKKTAGKDKNDVVGPFNPFQVRNDTPNPWEALMLQSGQKIQIRLGYSNDPNKLETVFNGRIVEMAPTESGDLLQIVCQSYAVELVQQVKGLTDNAPNLGESKSIGDTQELLSTLMCEPEVTHFGRWESNPFFNPAEMGLSTRPDYFDNRYSSFTPTGIINKIKRKTVEKWNFLNLPQDDNIFAPEKGTYYSAWREMLSINHLDYYLINTTIWDVFQEMELRHPGWIAYPQIYEDRYTMYFGVPAQRYWSTRPSVEERNDLDELKRIRKINGLGTGLADSDYIRQAASVGAKRNRFVPFRKYHLVTSEHHIISNNIAIDAKNSANAVGVEFRPTTWDNIPIVPKSKKFGSFETTTEKGETKLITSNLLTLKADDNIDDNNTRMLHETFFNCEGEYMARRYGLGLLLRHLKDLYTGEITIIGNPEIKPHDVCFVLDSYTDMFGPIGVEQVTHCFSFEEGFVTKIVPDLIVTGNEWFSTPMMDFIGRSVAQAFGEFNIANISKDTVVLTTEGTIGTGEILGATALAYSVPYAPAFVVGFNLFLLGGYKFVQWTQARHPVHITPLIFHGIPYIGGVEGFKHQNVWMYLKGKLLNWATGKEDGSFDDALSTFTRTYVGLTSGLEKNLFNWLSKGIQQ